MLDVIKGRGPLIVELKNGRRNLELCRKTYALLSDYRGEVCVESFNPMIMGWFRFHAKDLVRGQLAQPPKNYKGEVSKPAAFILGNCLMNFISRPQFIAYRIGRRPFPVRLSMALGAMNIGWTSHEPKNEKGRDGVIFEFYKPQLSYK